MNKKGFTLVEFAISFCLTATIAILILQLILSMKNIYLNGNIKTTLLSKQGIMLERIYKDFDNNNLKSVSSCGLSCLNFTYINSKNATFSAELKLDPYNKTITYDDYTIKLTNGSYIGDIDVDNSTINGVNASYNNSLLSIHIPVYNEFVEGDMGFNLTFPYNNVSTSVNISMSLENAIITLDSMTIPLAKVANVDGVYAELFYHNIASVQELFSSVDEVKRSETVNKRSALFALDLFKGKYQENLNTNVFEFLLLYPSYSTTENNHWYQINNFFKSEIEGFTPISIAWNNKWDSYGHFNGFTKITEDNECGYINGNDSTHNNCYTFLGAKKLVNNKFNFNQNGTNLTATSVRLLVRCDEFISKYALSKITQ